MSEVRALPGTIATTEQQQQQPQPPQYPHQALPQVAMSASGASNTSTGSSRRAVASSGSSSSHSASRVTPATTSSVRNPAVAFHQPHPAAAPPQPQQQQQQQQQQHATPPSPLLATLPSAETQRHIAEARAAVVASMGNMLDTELQGRAQMLHDNAGALDRQERDVLAATEALRRERERLAREADGAARRLKEVGNVQNWAEVLERGFLVLEETVRLANRRRGGGDDGSRSGSGSGSGSECSCSDCGRTLDGEQPAGGGEEMDEVDGEGRSDQGKGKAEEIDVAMNGLEVTSDASRSLFDGESSTVDGTGKAKNSETASLSTTC
ncbi:GCN5-like 1 [Beauveria brongniartii RCEF 3172]|uniref:Biogenesis of lysosome-related organelles complex 1 subunit 1 n=1 Tax=Beauveria brongniartii RCEF 3172 TaxID=1081107 RepID=A0A167L047_9HYPO|nr:GCN5-like 1 [Beauveria brongniartii RCEF 3172]